MKTGLGKTWILDRFEVRLADQFSQYASRARKCLPYINATKI